MPYWWALRHISLLFSSERPPTRLLSGSDSNEVNTFFKKYSKGLKAVNQYFNGHDLKKRLNLL